LSTEEDTLLIQKIAEFGKKWLFLTKFFQHRSDTDLKNRFQKIKKDQSFPQIENSQENNQMKIEHGMKEELFHFDESFEEFYSFISMFA
jgi:hypothetical protein